MKTKIIFLLSFWLTVQSTVYSIQVKPDSTLNLVDKGVIATKMLDGKNKLFARNFRGALNSFREVIALDKNNALANFRVAECYFELMNYELSKEHLDRAVELSPELDPETDYLYGKIYHRTAKLDEAVAAFEKFKTRVKADKLKNYEVEFSLAQISNARKFMASPLDVKIHNAGPNVNSRNDDYSPLFSPDGKILYFTSRRPQTTGGHQAEDRSFFEDIFFCKLADDGNWSEADLVEGKLNTDEFDNCSHISADGTTMYITQNIMGATKSSDIAVSKMGKGGKWGMAKLIKPLNTSFFDACPTLTPDEKTIYFISERNGEKKGSDIFKSTKTGKTWSPPITVTSCSSEENETTVWLHPNGKWLFFSSKGYDSMGGYDIFVSEWTGTDWGTPKNMGYPINSVNDDTHFRITPDGKWAYFSSVRPGGIGERDIYIVDLSTIGWLK